MAGMEITIRFPAIEAQLVRIADALEMTKKPKQPRILGFVPTNQERVDDMLKMVGFFQLTETEPGHGVTTRKLLVSNADSGAQLFQEDLPGDAVVSSEVKLAVGLNCSANLTDIDDAGNKSEPFTADFTVTDKMPPPKPGMLGFTPTGQVDEP